MTPRRRSASLFAAVAALLILVVLSGCGGDKAGKEVWYCPMHPTYVSDRPGSCPICNMDLVKKESPGAPSAAAAASAPSPPSERKVLFYRSPMDPSVTSPVPAKDSMGMDYVPVYSDETGTEANASSVADRAVVQVTGEGLRLAGVRTEPARRERLEQTVRTVGRVIADERRQARVQSRVSGWVVTLDADFIGRPVMRGERLAVIDSPELYAAQSEYLAAREAARSFLASSLPEVRRGGDDLIFAARRRLELLAVPENFLEELERTRVARRTFDLVAPASGYLSEKSVVRGQRIEPGMELLTIADLSHIWIEADFYESEARFLAPGRAATLRLPNDPTFALTARVSYIYPQLAVETRTLRVRFDVENHDLRLRPGMYVDVELATASAEGVVIPDSAILDSGVRQLVFVESAPGSFSPRDVEVALRADGKALIGKGLVEGEQVAVKANFLLDSESRLRAAIAAMAKGVKADGEKEPRP
jgi:multidrug efflux pump subunit AcrA (membrane-fusion protein)